MYKGNLFESISLDKNTEHFFEILQTNHIKIEKIVSYGQKSEENFWYEQEQNEFVVLLEGEAILHVQEHNGIKEYALTKGDFLDIKAYVKHRVHYTSEEQSTIWLAVFYA